MSCITTTVKVHNDAYLSDKIRMQMRILKRVTVIIRRMGILFVCAESAAVAVEQSVDESSRDAADSRVAEC